MTAATIGHASKPKSKRASSLWAENLSITPEILRKLVEGLR